uniref:Ras-GEF domain-containing protein n=1 Tax=Onchocerca flexuosa TaxID=387005 RepID=A0A183HQD8_9BILA
LRNSILRKEIHNTAITEADAYRPCGFATSDSSTSTQLPLAVKPLRQYQLKPEDSHISGENRYNPNITISSSLPRMSKTLASSSKALRKTLSGEFRQNSHKISSDEIVKSKCESETLIGTPMKKILRPPTCIARPIYCDNEMTRGSCETASSLQKIVAIRRTTQTGAKVAKSLPSTDMSEAPIASNIMKNSTVDIKWEVPKCGMTKDSMCGTIGKPAKSVLKIIRPRRLTVACSTLSDWPIGENTTLERNVTNRKIINGNDSLKRKTTRELPKKPWFNSSVDGPPVVSQIRETAIDDDLPSMKRPISSRLYSANGSSTIPVQKPTVMRSSNSQFCRMTPTPPPKPSRTYEEVLDDHLMQTEQPKNNSNSDIKLEQKTCSIMDCSTLAMPKDYRQSRDHSSDSGFGADFRKSSSDTISSPDVQTSGKWLQALDLPCDFYCLADEEDLMKSENSLTRFLFLTDFEIFFGFQLAKSILS